MTEIPGLELATEAVARTWYNLDHPNGADWWMLAPPADRGLYLTKAEAAVREAASYLSLEVARLEGIQWAINKILDDTSYQAWWAKHPPASLWGAARQDLANYLTDVGNQK